MTDLEKARLNKLFLVEGQLGTLADKAIKLGWKYNYKDDKELIEDVTYLFNNLRNLANDIGNVRCDLYMEWNKEKVNDN